MKTHDSILHGVGATALMTFAGVEDFGLKLGTSVLIAVVSTLISAGVKALLAKWRQK